MKKAALFFIISTFLAIANSQANAHTFDGQRKGLQIGLGLGAHTSELTYKSNFAPSDIDSEQSLAVTFLVGYGFSNRVVGYVGGKGGGILIDDREASLAIGGFGASVYLTELSPSLYLSGLVGKATLALDAEQDADNDSGNGWLIGIGYEIAGRLHLELSHAEADLTDPNNSADTSTLESSFLTLQYIWY